MPVHSGWAKRPVTPRHCGNGRASAHNGAITMMNSMCWVMCQAVLVSAQSSMGPNTENTTSSIAA